MVSDINIVDERWEDIDALAASDVCQNVPEESLPHTTHFCNHYGMGRWFFFIKNMIRKDFLSCNTPLLHMPPSDVAMISMITWFG